MFLAVVTVLPVAASASDLESGFLAPPPSARVWAYWWWLNGNVTRQAITRDLEEMKAKGFGGAVLFDGDGSSQDGNEPVPPGPTFFSPQWRGFYKHALQEADRLGLELTLNIQSGWNLGGPIIKPEEAAKLVVWSATQVTGPTNLDRALPTPKSTQGFYRDIAVLAYPLKSSATSDSFLGASSSSFHPDYPASRAVDAHPETFWVSGGTKAGEGPSRQRPEWLQLNFNAPITATGARILGRPGYGPRECQLQVSDDGQSFRTLRSFSLADGQEELVSFETARAAHFRLLVLSAFDPGSPAAPRNVQIAEFTLTDGHRSFPTAGRAGRQPIRLLEIKTAAKEFAWSSPDCWPLLEDFPAVPGEEDCASGAITDLSHRLDTEGRLRWQVPAGTWEILRLGYTISGAQVSTPSAGWNGLALDYLDPEAFRSYWRHVVGPLIADAGPLAGRSLKYLMTDSWELGGVNWTRRFREEFRQRRGYDPTPFLPVLAGRIVDSRPVSNRFLNDLRKTVGDCIADNHYRLMSEMARPFGIGIHPESGGPHGAPIDSLRLLGLSDVPMSEFWARSWRHRVADTDRFFVKQPAAAAHTYGRRIVAAEAFTTIGPHWQETLWDNLKPSFDQAACEGLNRLVWSTFVCSPAETGVPGQQFFAGTHLNPKVTWWAKSAPFFAYFNRCQFLLQQGLFVADACYYYGDMVPNFAQLKRADPAKVLPGYDYDVATEEVVLTRMSVHQGRVVLPDGMSYRLLVLPDKPILSLAVLRQLKELVKAGASVIGPKPDQAPGLSNYPQCDDEVRKLAAELWGSIDGKSVTQRAFGIGRVFWGRTAREVLTADGVRPDFECDGDRKDALDYLHRHDGETEIYFVTNRSNRWEAANCSFRVSGKAPELWDPVTGETRMAAAFTQTGGHTILPLEFPSYGSLFIVFRKPISMTQTGAATRNFPTFSTSFEVTGPWTVKFDPKWGGPASAEFAQLISWTERSEPGIRFYSGAATYERTFDAPVAARHAGQRLWLDLGNVRELAQVWLNGKSLGVLWSPPFRADITGLLKPADNTLRIEVVNFWPNRIIGDASLPPAQRFTSTNIRKLTKDTPLMPSGLLGPLKVFTSAR